MRSSCSRAPRLLRSASNVTASLVHGPAGRPPWVESLPSPAISTGILLWTMRLSLRAPWVLIMTTTISCAASGAPRVTPSGGSYDDLVALFHDWRSFEEP